MSSLRSDEIEQEKDEPKKKYKFLALKSQEKKTKSKAPQAEVESEDNDSEEENEELKDENLEVMSSKILRMCHNKKNFFPQRYSRHSIKERGDKSEKKIIFFNGCNEPSHLKIECLDLKKC